MDNITAFGCMLFEMCKPWVNQILSCANQNQQCVNFFPPYANPYIAAIPKCFAKSCWAAAYFYMLITCRTFLVQSGEVTFWGQKKFTHFITGLTGLPPDGSWTWICLEIQLYIYIYIYIYIYTRGYISLSQSSSMCRTTTGVQALCRPPPDSRLRQYVWW